METFVVFLKIMFFNMKLLKFSIFNLKQSLWDHCLGILSSWIDSNRYCITENLHNANLPKSVLSHFGAKAAKIEAVKVDPVFLTVEELLSLDLASYERLSNAAEFFHYTTLAITRYSNAIRGAEESVNIGLIIKFMRSLYNWKLEEFMKCLRDYLFRYLKPTLQLEYELNSKVLLRLHQYEQWQVLGDERCTSIFVEPGARKAAHNLPQPGPSAEEATGESHRTLAGAGARREDGVEDHPAPQILLGGADSEAVCEPPARRVDHELDEVVQPQDHAEEPEAQEPALRCVDLAQGDHLRVDHAAVPAQPVDDKRCWKHQQSRRVDQQGCHANQLVLFLADEFAQAAVG
ncbi:hypothetical protein PMKS-001412 [Pichia membranifaciens]|uniref:Uncharacterized protein n=1 Tax=Pichia membranifaciens TaxID=4926 RepID=A0A1Q2YEI6_9ASCO|nr:hypothetical protein PMKS-001412 [Pichia membranifaciens]